MVLPQQRTKEEEQRNASPRLEPRKPLHVWDEAEEEQG